MLNEAQGQLRLSFNLLEIGMSRCKRKTAVCLYSSPNITRRFASDLHLSNLSPAKPPISCLFSRQWLSCYCWQARVRTDSIAWWEKCKVTEIPISGSVGDNHVNARLKMKGETRQRQLTLRLSPVLACQGWRTWCQSAGICVFQTLWLLVGHSVYLVVSFLNSSTISLSC